MRVFRFLPMASFIRASWGGFLVAVSVLLATAHPAHAAEIRVQCTIGMESVMHELIPEFERVTGHHVLASYENTNNILERLNQGVAVDLVILTSDAIDALIAQGLVERGSRVDLARSRIGLAVRRGAPKPDIRTPEALKKTLLEAKSLAFSTAGVSGLHFASIIEGFGIGDQLKGRITRVPSGPVGRLVAQGEVEVAVQQLSELLPVEGIDVVGPLPDSLQKITTFAAGTARNTTQAAVVRSFVELLSRPANASLLKAKGLETR